MEIKLFDSELKIMDVLWKEGDTGARRIAEISRFSIYSLINTLTAWFSGANMPILEIIPSNLAGTAADTINPTLSDTPVISISPIMVI